MNRLQFQLFQVYVMEENEKIRFQIQVNENGTFDITLKEVCPEQPLSDAILHHGLKVNA